MNPRSGVSRRQIALRRLRLWHLPRSGIPDDRETMTAWLRAQWTRLDTWIAEDPAR